MAFVCCTFGIDGLVGREQGTEQFSKVQAGKGFSKEFVDIVSMNFRANNGMSILLSSGIVCGGRGNNWKSKRSELPPLLL